MSSSPKQRMGSTTVDKPTRQTVLSLWPRNRATESNFVALCELTGDILLDINLLYMLKSCKSYCMDKPSQETTNTEKKRGILLTLLLWFFVITTSISIFTLLYKGPSAVVLKHYHNYSSALTWVYFLFVVVINILNFVCIIGIWKWKRWGVYGFISIGVILFLIGIFMGS